MTKPLGNAILSLAVKRKRNNKYASVAQLVEQGTENPRVVGSIPTGGTTFPGSATADFPLCEFPPLFADLAHLVERNLAKVEVASSSLVIRSTRRHSQAVRQRSAKPLRPSSNLGGASNLCGFSSFGRAQPCQG